MKKIMIFAMAGILVLSIHASEKQSELYKQLTKLEKKIKKIHDRSEKAKKNVKEKLDSASRPIKRHIKKDFNGERRYWSILDDEWTTSTPVKIQKKLLENIIKNTMETKKLSEKEYDFLKKAQKEIYSLESKYSFEGTPKKNPFDTVLDTFYGLPDTKFSLWEKTILYLKSWFYE